jgi:hypothetical protein
MKLWIRTADKRGLYEVCGIRVEGVDLQTYDIIGFFNSKQVILGEYDTFNRCIEIIDEIQGLLRGDLHIFLTACDVPNEVYRDLVTRKNNTILCEPNIEYLQSNVMVYQMPEE